MSMDELQAVLCVEMVVGELVRIADSLERLACIAGGNESELKAIVLQQEGEEPKE